MPILIKTHHLIEYVHNIRYSTTDNIMLSYFVVFMVYAYHQVLLCQITLILFCSYVSGIVIDCNMCSCCICWTFSSSSSKLRESIAPHTRLLVGGEEKEPGIYCLCMCKLFTAEHLFKQSITWMCITYSLATILV